MGVQLLLERYSGHDHKIVVQLQRQPPPRGRFFEIDNEEDEVLEDKEDEIELTIVDAQT